MMSLHYLDNAAGMLPCAEALAEAELALHTAGNPSSLHPAGLESRALLEKATLRVQTALGCAAGEFIFTSGGTEANNTAIFSAAKKNFRAGKRILTTGAEHPSVTAALKTLAGEGFSVETIASPGGVFDLSFLREKLAGGDVCLVTVTAVSNLTGSIFPVREIRRILTETGSGALLHCDDAQGFLKTPESPVRYADTVTVSAHKIGGLKGCGALYLRKGLRFAPLLCGGEQQDGRRPGTENLTGIAAFGAAAACFASRSRETIPALRERFLTGAKQELGDAVSFFIPPAHIEGLVSCSVPAVNSEVMLNHLASQGICISASSACSPRVKSDPALASFALPEEYMRGALRVAFSPDNTPADVDALIDGLKTGLQYKRIR